MERAPDVLKSRSGGTPDVGMSDLEIRPTTPGTFRANGRWGLYKIGPASEKALSGLFGFGMEGLPQFVPEGSQPDGTLRRGRLVFFPIVRALSIDRP